MMPDALYRFFAAGGPIKSKYIEPAQQQEGEKLWTSRDARKASEILSQHVKGVVFTGQNDGKVAVAYDPGTVVPVAWCYSLKATKEGRAEQDKEENFPAWRGVDKESIRKSMNRALGQKGASRDYIPGRYNVGDIKKAAE